MYLRNGLFQSTNGSQSSTAVTTFITISSNTTDASKQSTNIIDYTAPAMSMYEYQVMVYNASTTPFSCNIYTREIGISTASTQDYMLLDTFNVPISTGTGLGRAIQNVHGIFNTANTRFDFVNNTSGSSNSTSSRITMAIKSIYKG